MTKTLAGSYTRIEICGGIASGKTTLCKVLAQAGVDSRFENFQLNPFWNQFHTNPKLYAFETEVTFLLQHYSQIKTSITCPSGIAFDYSLIQDEAYARVNLNGYRLATFEAVYQYVTEDLPPPTLIVHLECTPEEELNRVRNRARSEEKAIELTYLAALNKAIACAVDEVRAHIAILKVDSAALDFAHDPETQRRVVSDILSAVGTLGVQGD